MATTRAHTDPRIDAYIEKSAEFAQPILVHLREVIHAAVPDVQETIKWSMPFFMHGGKILGHIAAFKAHCGFGLWGDLPDGGKATEAMGRFGRIETLKDLPAKTELKRLIKTAAAQIDSGERALRRPKGAAKPPPEVPDDLAAALRRSSKAKKTFEAFSPSNQRDYVEWLTEAKRAETREKRLAQAVEWMEEGKTRHWKYQNC